MKRFLIVLIGLSFFFGVCHSTPPYNKITFKENKGQVHDQNAIARPDVLFSGTIGSTTFHLRSNGISYQLYKALSWKEIKNQNIQGQGKTKVVDKFSIYRIDFNWINANKSTEIVKDAVLEGFDNYYNESCPNGANNVQTFSGITYKKLYNGIDLHYYDKGGQLKYDYLVEPKSDYKQIKIQIEGSLAINLNNKGELIVKTPFGEVTEGKPIVFQEGKILDAKWVIEKDVLFFEINNYDSSLPMIIDPLTRVWGTHYGGIGNEQAYYSATDISGNVFMSGYSDSNSGTVIATTGSHQSTLNGTTDAFLVKFNSAGFRQWSTYYGGAGDDQSFSCATDAVGNIFLSGYTNSNSGTVIATLGSHQSTCGGSYDAFLVKFNSNGIRQWGTYYGGSGDDKSYSCTIDKSGNIYLAGYTDSSIGIATMGSHQSSYNGFLDAFIVKFNSVGARQWGTYYGGIGHDRAYSCVTDTSGNVYLAGFSHSSGGTVIATVGSHQSTNGGFNDAFLVKFNSAGIRQWGTYYGGSGPDEAYSCAIDRIGNVYFSGFATSNTGTEIATIGSHQPTNAGGLYDAFLVKFNSAGIRQWGTYYGGTGDDIGYSCNIDPSSNIFISGFTNSSTGTAISTVGSFQSTYGGGGDAFLVQFDSSGVRQWGTYYGGPGQDEGRMCSTDGLGNLYMPGYVSLNTGTVIATAGSHQLTYGGGTYDAFLVKFNGISIGISNLFEGGNYFNVFPNPFTDKIIISSYLPFDFELQIYNTLGSIIYSSKIENGKSEINLSNQPSGIYFIKAGSVTKKIIKQ